MAHTKQLNTFHLFAGAGGGILADLLLGHNPVGACEIEEYPREVLLARQRDGILPGFPIWDDICTLDGKPWRGKVDVVCGGFPCQDISIAGNGDGIDGEKSGMWGEMARIISEIRPRYVFVENSPMLVGRGLARVLGDLAKMGYDARWCVLGAGDVGAPHYRDRIWILAYAKELFGYECEPLGEDGRAQEQELGSGNSSLDVSDSEVLHSQGCGIRPGQGELGRSFGGDGWWDEDPAEQEEGESRVGRMADGVADVVDRLKAIGNGQVPQCAALAWRILNATPTTTTEK